MGIIAKSGFDLNEIQKFTDKIEKILPKEVEALIESCAKELAARLLRLVKERTLPGVYPSGSGKVGGTLRRGWRIGDITQNGDTYTIEVINEVEYASYVEFGHRKRGGNGSGSVPGKYMLTYSEQDIKKITPGLLERRVGDKLKEWFK